MRQNEAMFFKQGSTKVTVSVFFFPWLFFLPVRLLPPGRYTNIAAHITVIWKREKNISGFGKIIWLIFIGLNLCGFQSIEAAIVLSFNNMEEHASSDSPFERLSLHKDR